LNPPAHNTGCGCRLHLPPALRKRREEKRREEKRREEKRREEKRREEKRREEKRREEKRREEKVFGGWIHFRLRIRF
ncbi:hypothetical protein, partial [Neisseria meningitidis]|uniref:hypothetical protein n=1 Tax=Neisseria meningitidis TaxID=487 RepID=UPI00186537F6